MQTTYCIIAHKWASLTGPYILLLHKYSRTECSNSSCPWLLAPSAFAMVILLLPIFLGYGKINEYIYILHCGPINGQLDVFLPAWFFYSHHDEAMSNKLTLLRLIIFSTYKLHWNDEHSILPFKKKNYAIY